MPDGSIRPKRAGENSSNGKISSVTELAPVRDYLDRVAFGKWSAGMHHARVIEQYGSYPSSLARINFDVQDGAVVSVGRHDISEAEFAATDAEQLRIKDALASASFFERRPIVIGPVHDFPGAKNAAALRAKGDGSYFEFYGPLLPDSDKRNGRSVEAVQIRVQKGSKKRYLTLTYWEDGQWRLIEPDPLPLYNGHRCKDAGLIVIHEGAGTADYCQRLTDDPRHPDRAKVPWAVDLFQPDTVHVGWIGGANRPLASDWEPVIRSSVSRVVIVSDNDRIGKKAVRWISKALARGNFSVQWLDVPSEFGNGWDMADPFPKKLFDENGRWMGPEYHNLLRSATWATEVAERKPNGDPKSYRLREPFKAEWAVVTLKRAVYVNLNRRYDKLNEEQFEKRVRPFSDRGQIPALMDLEHINQFEGLCFRPGAKLEVAEEVRKLNTYAAPRIKPDRYGDPKPWLDYLEHLIPSASDRHEVKRWVATLIAMPARRMKYGLLLTSVAQGTGKTTLYYALKPLIGAWQLGRAKA